MTTPVQLKTLIDALEEQADTLFAFLDRDTGQIELVSEEALARSESEQEEIDSLAGLAKRRSRTCDSHPRLRSVSRSPQ
jgi:hypothetical protein